jgi:four helix bundle protein
METGRVFDLEDRLVDFAARCIKVSVALPDNLAGQHLAGQLCRSGTSPALNYGEAQGAEPRKDFIHKMKIGLKELRETLVCLKIIVKAKLLGADRVGALSQEADELISIFVTSIKTTIRNAGETS